MLKTQTALAPKEQTGGVTSSNNQHRQPLAERLGVRCGKTINKELRAQLKNKTTPPR
jgi:phage-related baseplate assembly protein